MVTVNVEIPSSGAGQYPVVIGAGLLGSCWDEICKLSGSSRKIVVTDRNVADAGLIATLCPDESAPIYIIDPPGEVSKHFQTIIGILETMEAAKMGRDTLVVAVGGGTVGDMAGFAAAIFKRGVPVVHIPTTTVAQADSSIGGKTGVDSSVSKNAYGAFWHPRAVFVDVHTLRTLDQRQYNSGLVESLKHAMIADAEYFDFFEANIDGLLARDDSVLEQIAQKNARIKADVVQSDPTEKNQRRILNYGHTIGHAVESASGYSLLHGECVGIGMLGAALIEIEMGIGSQERFGRVQTILKKLNLPTRIPQEQSCSELLELLKSDKKAVNAWPKFALVEGVGKPYCKDGQWAHDVDIDIVANAITLLK